MDLNEIFSLVISGLVALGLLGFGGFYLWQSMGKNQQVDTDINQTKSEIERLLNKDVTPSPSNLNNAKRELERLNAFIAEAKKQFPPSLRPLNRSPAKASNRCSRTRSTICTSRPTR